MKVLGLVWVGVRTAEFDRTLEFFRDVLGVPLTEVSEGFGVEPDAKHEPAGDLRAGLPL